MRILIANRGEVARRIIRTAHRLGHTTAAAYADPDRDAPFVAEATIATRLGPGDLAASYLSIDALLAAADRTGADAVHPGYGFLAERADFARAVRAQGLVWIGPHPNAMERMASKIEARRVAAAVGVAVIPGDDASQDPADLAAAAQRIGYPVLVKASAGGGGRGIRVARSAGEFDRALSEAAVEADRAFGGGGGGGGDGDGALFVERFVPRSRHIEVQVVADRHGTVVDLGTRECSLQRRYQKVIEEAPAPNLAGATEEGLRRSAVELARAIGYDSAGTVEFILDDRTGDYFFLEMNTRLQVEHPVTELVTGLDLVELQLVAAEGRPLPAATGGVVARGHAFEARINAEDPGAGFAPTSGRIEGLVLPDGVRWDSAVEVGSEVTSHYDSMVGKLVVAGPDRETARRRLVAALDGLLVAGVGTNGGFLRWLLTRPEVVAGRATTRFIDEAELPPAPPLDDVARRAAALWQARRDATSTGGGTWSRIGRFRLTPHRRSTPIVLTTGDQEWEVVPDSGGPPPEAGHEPCVVDGRARLVAVNHEGATITFRVPSRQERGAHRADQPGAAAHALVAPFPGLVAEVNVVPGQVVHEGDVLVVLEAMKMLHPLAAAGTATVEAVAVRRGEQVASGTVLVAYVAAVAIVPSEPTDTEPSRE